MMPLEARATFERLFGTGIRGPEQLREQIPHYVRTIEQAASEHEALDPTIGRRIARDCEELLDAWDGFETEPRALIRAAVEYFLLMRDGDDDLTSPDGLADDEAVVKAVRRYLRV